MKAVQAAAVLLRNEGTKMTRLRLLKLLLIADRKSIKEMGVPILGSKIVAMDNGPLHSEIYDLIKGSSTVRDDLVKIHQDQWATLC